MSRWLVSHPLLLGQAPPGAQCRPCELTMLSWRGTQGNPSGRGGWADPQAGAPTRHTSPLSSPPATARASASLPGPEGVDSGCSAVEPTDHPSTRHKAELLLQAFGLQTPSHAPRAVASGSKVP